MRIFSAMRPKRFVEAVRGLRFAEVLDDGDLPRFEDLLLEAGRTLGKPILVGFRVRGPVVRIFWVIITAAGPATDDDLAGLPPSEAGYVAFELRYCMSEGPTAQLDDLDEAKPPELKDSPAMLVSYPGRVSWEKLNRVSEQLLDS